MASQDSVNPQLQHVGPVRIQPSYENNTCSVRITGGGGGGLTSLIKTGLGGGGGVGGGGWQFYIAPLKHVCTEGTFPSKRMGKWRVITFFLLKIEIIWLHQHIMMVRSEKPF